MTLTRYLYDKQLVEQSLLASLVARDKEQAKFWAFELFHSGFHDETMHLLIELYYRLYINRYPNMEDFIRRQLYQWTDDKDWVVGTIVENFAIRTPDVALYNASNAFTQQIDSIDEGYAILDEFCGSSMLRESLPSETCPSSIYLFRYACISRIYRTGTCVDRRAYVVLSKDDVAKYRNIPFVRGKSWKILRRLSLYPVTSAAPVTSATGDGAPDDNWLARAYHSPIWKKRIHKYGGKLVDGHVAFDDQDAEIEFRSWYDLEPDEQPTSVKSCWSRGNLR